VNAAWKRFSAGQTAENLPYSAIGEAPGLARDGPLETVANLPIHVRTGYRARPQWRGFSINQTNPTTDPGSRCAGFGHVPRPNHRPAGKKKGAKEPPFRE